jgi:hypothetical protein
MEQNKIIPLLLVIVVFLGAFAIVGSASTVDASSNRPRLSIRVSDREVLVDETSDHWFYVTNPSWDMERPPIGEFHNVELSHVCHRTEPKSSITRQMESHHQTR